MNDTTPTDAAAISIAFLSEGGLSGELPTIEGARYVIANELGQGGMGRIVLARDTRLGRDVAIKEARTPEHEAMLLREARIVARLEHPNIVPIHDLGHRADGTLYFVMRVVRGESLADLVDPRRRPPLTSAERMGLLRHVLDACEAVAFAHRHGVVHRDLKPANIMIGDYGETQVIDWGLAADSREAELQGVVGTPGYMAPEQVLGAVDARGDTYALGVVLVELVGGRGAIALVREGDVGAAFPKPARELAAIARRAVAKDPDLRYAEAKGLADDLRRYLDGRPVEAYAYTARDVLKRFARAWRRPLIAIGIVLALALAFIAMTLVRLDAERDHAIAAKTDATKALARALLGEALQHSRDDRAAAELAAGQALSLGESADARGVLSGLAYAPRPRLLSREPLPDCLDVVIGPGGPLCRMSDRVVAIGRWQWLGQARGVAESGDQVVVQAVDGRVVVLDGASGRVVETGRRQMGTLVGATDGAFALHHSGNFTIAVYGGVAATLPMPCRGVVLVAAADATRIVAACSDGGVHTWPVATAGPWAPLADVDGFAVTVTQIGFARGEVILGMSSGAVRVGGRNITATTGIVRRLAASPDGASLAVIGEDGRVVIMAGERRVALLPDKGWLDVRWLDDTTLVAAGTTLERWRIDPIGANVMRLPHGIPGVALAPDGDTLAVAVGSELVAVSARRGEVLGRERWQDLLVKAVAYGSDSALYTQSIGDMQLHVWRDGLRRELGVVGVRRIVALADGDLLVSLAGVGLARITPSVGAARRVEVLDKELRDLAGTHDGMLAAWGAVDGTFGLAHSGRWEVTPLGRSRDATAVFPIVIEGEPGVLVAERGGVEAWDATGLRGFYAAPRAELIEVASDREQRWVAAGARDGAVWLWSRDGTLVARYLDHTERVATLVFDADGRWLASGSFDHTLRFRDLATLSAEPAQLLADIRRDWAMIVSRP